MNEENEIGVICPDCGSTEVGRSASWPLHLVRVLGGSRKRYCRKCGRRWHLEAGFTLPEAPLFEQAWFLLVLGISAGVLVAILAQGLIPHTHPDWVQRRIKVARPRR